MRPCAITDIYGAAGTGKTQLAKQIAACCMALGGRVLFVDTTGKFRPERILEMLRGAGSATTLDSLYVLRATSSSEQAAALCSPEIHKADLVIVDSASDLYSFEYGREAQLQIKNSLFMEYMHALSAVALNLRIPVVITNMIREFDGVTRENMQPAIRQFTHARIGLSKEGSRSTGSVILPGSRADFDFEMSPTGLCERRQTI